MWKLQLCWGSVIPWLEHLTHYCKFKPYSHPLCEVLAQDSMLTLLLPTQFKKKKTWKKQETYRMEFSQNFDEREIGTPLVSFDFELQVWLILLYWPNLRSGVEISQKFPRSICAPGIKRLRALKYVSGPDLFFLISFIHQVLKWANSFKGHLDPWS